MPKTHVQQIVDQRRGSPADVDDSRRRVDSSALEQGNRHAQMRCKPTHVIRSQAAINPLPMIHETYRHAAPQWFLIGQ
jgi:hypothetical protein